ncbi:hypothetical protein SAMN05519105_0641 [Rhodobacter sp. 24-YEA-8]|nr:hypothetical protein SAMN05519105_0641 [Rhodobacter sp. 24-YEA-8]
MLLVGLIPVLVLTPFFVHGPFGLLYIKAVFSFVGII